MKGGKEGRKRRSAGGDASSNKRGPRGKPAKGDAKRPAGAAPRKGSRKKSFGATATSDET